MSERLGEIKVSVSGFMHRLTLTIHPRITIRNNLEIRLNLSSINFVLDCFLNTQLMCSYYLEDEDVNFSDGALVRDKVTLL